MRRVLRALARLPLWQKLVVAAMLLLIVVTWAAVWLLLAGHLGG